MGNRRRSARWPNRYLEVWESQYKLPFPDLMDTQRATAAYFPTPHPPGLLIDMKTMHVLKGLHGYETAAQFTTCK